MIGARRLLKYSFNFLLSNPLLLFYGFVYFLPVISAIIGVIILAISVGTLSLITFSFPIIVRTVLGVLFGSFFAIGLMILFFFIVILFSLSFTAYVQSNLRHGNSSIKSSFRKSLRICSSVFWVVPTYIVYFFVSNSILWVFAFAVFCYVPQILLDGEISFTKSFSLSWQYFKKTWWVMARFFMLIILIASILLLGALASLSLAAMLIPFISASIVFSVLALIIFFGLFLFCILGSMIIIIGTNKLYLEVKQQH
ncbi:MAG: hypothetical protein K2X90_03125 [Candidatus Babeliaceae bacterium]|nr:hypothetical protein [Candidatus Babeliaceae bacterium]